MAACKWPLAALATLAVLGAVSGAVMKNQLVKGGGSSAGKITGLTAKQGLVGSNLLTQLLTPSANRPVSVPSPNPGPLPAPSSVSGLIGLIDAIPSLQNFLDASGLSRITDPVINQARKRWERIRDK